MERFRDRKSHPYYRNKFYINPNSWYTFFKQFILKKMNSSSGSSSLSDNEDEITNYLIIDKAIDEIQGAIISHIHARNTILHTYINQQVNEGPRRGSIPGHIVIHRDREIADQNLFNDYFAENPRFHEVIFRRRFRMSRHLFLHIVDGVKNHDSYFIQRSDGLGRLGLSTNQKATAAIRMLAYAMAADATDEYIKIGESTAIECLQRFCRAVVEVFGAQYLRAPTANDVARLLHIGKQRGFPAQGIAPPANYTIYGKEYNTGYYLADGNYPKWSTIVQTISNPLGPKKRYFAMKQESCRKDVERAFGVFQSRFAIVANPARSWRKNNLHDIMTACIIMHNMIIEDERDLSAPIEDAREAPLADVEMVVNDESTRFEEFISRYKKIKNREAHYELRNALIEHLWEEYSNSNI
ncbi:uncharacterized protein [Primulina huaijiensis]|uniref:uncharacterized protein n=1 Tax=Primulina huaijiensis TaxID=1492673 RepID=UPI003CC79952